MIPKMRRKKKPDHPIRTNPDGSMLIEGYPEGVFRESFGLIAKGPHFHEYGIADNSLLLCSPALEPKDGDVVVLFGEEQPVLYIFRPGAPEGMDGDKRVIGDPGRVDAVVLSSLNFYR